MSRTDTAVRDGGAERPRARDDDLLAESLGDELLIFDATTNRAHSLNTTAATVWHACDGTSTCEQIPEHCQLDPMAVALALDMLADSKLLDDYSPPAERVSRRTVIHRLALTGASLGIALPVIRSIVAPSVAMAASGRSGNQTVGHAGEPCTSNGPCASGSFCTSHGSCRRDSRASCVNTSSCGLYPSVATTCQEGVCKPGCSANNPCPASYPVCGGSFCFNNR